MYQQRTLDAVLDEYLQVFSAISVVGPKAVGKTTTLTQRAQRYNAINPEIAQYLADPYVFSDLQNQSYFIDEWQRVPSVWDRVRDLVDEGAPAGTFLLAGSAALTGAHHIHSGAGRIIELRMRPQAWHERGINEPVVSFTDLITGKKPNPREELIVTREQYLNEVLTSGFPGIRNISNERLRHQALNSYIDALINKDLVEEGILVRRPALMRTWWRAYAAATATTASYTTIAQSTGDNGQPAARQTMDRYRDQLSLCWQLDPLEPYIDVHQIFGSLAKSPKHYLADPALAAVLLSFTSATIHQPENSVYAGRLFEHLCVLGLQVLASRFGYSVSHLRSSNGNHEVDVLIEDFEGRILAVEIKLAATVTGKECTGLNWCAEKFGDRLIDKVIITGGRLSYRRPDGILVLPLAQLGL